MAAETKNEKQSGTLSKQLVRCGVVGVTVGVIGALTHKEESGEQKAAPLGLMLKLLRDERPHLTGQL